MYRLLSRVFLNIVACLNVNNNVTQLCNKSNFGVPIRFRAFFTYYMIITRTFTRQGSSILLVLLSTTSFLKTNFLRILQRQSSHFQWLEVIQIHNTITNFHCPLKRAMKEMFIFSFPLGLSFTTLSSHCKFVRNILVVF